METGVGRTVLRKCGFHAVCVALEVLQARKLVVNAVLEDACMCCCRRFAHQGS